MKPEFVTEGDELYVVLNGIKLAKRSREDCNEWFLMGPSGYVVDVARDEETDELHAFVAYFGDDEPPHLKTWSAELRDWCDEQGLDVRWLEDGHYHVNETLTPEQVAWLKNFEARCQGRD